MRSRRTVLIGIDGATFTVLDPMIERGLMPFLAGLVDRGVRAPLRTVMPPLTPPAWASLMTGKRPGEHGVFDFFQKEEAGSEYYHLTGSADVRTPTIWSLASEHGKRVISLNYPVMFPPPAVDGVVVPGGWMPWRQLRLGCHPPGLFDSLKRLPSFEPKEMALDMALEAKAIEGCPREEYADWIALHIRREQRWLDVLRHLLSSHQHADLVGIMFDGTDKLQHLCWRFIDIACQPTLPTPWEMDMIELCESYFRQLDRTIEQVVALAGPDATVLVASDHGFAPTWDLFYVNAWLERQGWLAWKEDLVAVGDAPQIGFAQMTRHVHELDWERTVAYAATPTSQGINLVDRSPQLRMEIVEALRAVRNPVTDRPIVRDVLSREHAYPGPYAGLGPDLSLVLADGTAISIMRSDELVRRRPEPYGNHDWQGVFVAAGPGIRAGARLEELSILDVAPTVLYSLDVPIPDDLTGRLASAAFTTDHLERRPPRTTRAVGGPVLTTDVELELDADEEKTIMNRLRALGYVE
jgi:predicted AlkP superfamily phosphohydrolase/phosphomutase